MKKKTKKILIILLFTILFLSASFIIFIGKMYLMVFLILSLGKKQ